MILTLAEISDLVRANDDWPEAIKELVASHEEMRREWAAVAAVADTLNDIEGRYGRDEVYPGQHPSRGVFYAVNCRVSCLQRNLAIEDGNRIRQVVRIAELEYLLGLAMTAGLAECERLRADVRDNEKACAPLNRDRSNPIADIRASAASFTR